MTVCKGCGKPIEWGITEQGKKIPLDPGPTVYAISSMGRTDGCKSVIKLAKGEAYVSHFILCPNANDF